MVGKLYCSVRITDIAYSADKGYAYMVPPSMRDTLRKGSIVLVPFGHGNRLRKGIVTGFSDYCEYSAIKPVSEILEDYGLVSEETVDMCLFMAERCFCTVGAALRAILPPGMESTVEYLYSCGEADENTLNPKAQVIFRSLREKERTESDLISLFGEEAKGLLSALTSVGAVKRQPVTKESINEKNLSYVRLAVDTDTAYQNAKTEKQVSLVDALSLEGEISVTELERFFSVSRSVVNTLCKKNICEIFERRIVRDPVSEKSREKFTTPLTDEQEKAVKDIDELLSSGEPKAALLYGVTGSGKTRVIIEAVKKTLETGKSAIVLIPEIGLTSEAVGIYYAEFGEKLAVIHSMLSIGERIDTARAISAGEKTVVIGTRSAVFAPLKNLGIIVIDEEQEHTYKSENTPKFHARDIARFRCAYNKCVMLLASATPSVESFYKAKQGIYKLITLKHRYGSASLPDIILSDIKQDSTVNGGRLIGKELKEKLISTVEDGKQAILFVGRRGYSS
ncbi:MAG: DEAD/DEAH box helicase family protein, partial [Clostridia bacterium]|nr:DEAD/DEAH box helicase family protein [Clostridia bacterium]